MSCILLFIQVLIDYLWVFSDRRMVGNNNSVGYGWHFSEVEATLEITHKKKIAVGETVDR